MFFGLDFACRFPFDVAGDLKTAAQMENQLTFMELFNRFSNIAVTRYKWSGLPETVNERFLNTALYLWGKAAFFHEPDLGFLALPCNTQGEFNIYYDPVRVNAFSFNYEATLKYGQFVYMRNNPTATPTVNSVWCYTRKMADVLRTIDVLTKKMKQPYIFMCDEKEVQTYKALMKKTLDNEIMILGSKKFGLDRNNFELLECKVNGDLTKLWDTYRSMETILCTALGIASTGPEKRERLIMDEVNANNMLTDMSIEQNIKELQHACEEINRMFNLNVWVEAETVDDYLSKDDEDYDGAKSPSGLLARVFG